MKRVSCTRAVQKCPVVLHKLSDHAPDRLPQTAVNAKTHGMNAPRENWLWDDVRFFLTICREGSLAAAARSLGVDHSTVGRRLAAFERMLGAKLITRTPGGLIVTPAGRQILADCEAMEASSLSVQRRRRRSGHPCGRAGQRRYHRGPGLSVDRSGTGRTSRLPARASRQRAGRLPFAGSVPAPGGYSGASAQAHRVLVDTPEAG